MALVLDWQKRLGYRKDPFETTVQRPVKKFITGLLSEQERITLFLIRNNPYGTITGPEGSGKTTLLQWLSEELDASRKYRGIYIDAAQAGTKPRLLDLLLPKGKMSFRKRFGKILKVSVTDDEKEREILKTISKKVTIILVDNARKLSSTGKEFLSAISGHATLIFADETLENEGFGQDMLGLQMPEQDPDVLVEILRKRIETRGGSRGTFPFEKDHLDALTKKAKGNPGKLLELAREKAIELSLRVERKPRSAPATPDEKRGFFSIRIEKGPSPEKPPAESESLENQDLRELDAIASVLEKGAQSSPAKGPVEEPDEFMLEDTEEIPVAEDKPSPKARTGKTEYDKVIEGLAEKPRPRKKPARKGPRKKKARKKKGK